MELRDKCFHSIHSYRFDSEFEERMLMAGGPIERIYSKIVDSNTNNVLNIDSGSIYSSYITGNIMEVSGGYHLGTPQYAEFVGHKAVEDK